MRNKKTVGLLVAVGLISSIFFSCFSFANTISFPDTPDWCASAINEMASDGVLSGFQDGTFKPNQAMTRAQMAKVLQKIYVPEVDYDYMHDNESNKKYLDKAENANPDNWANVYIATANAISIDSFGYDYANWSQPASRIEMAQMAAQYASLRLLLDGNENPVLNAYAELGSYIGDYASFQNDPNAMAVLWMYGECLVNGSDAKGSFKPYSSITRAQACAILYRVKHEDARVSVLSLYQETNTSNGTISGDYKPGSVYGPKLSQKELDDVKAAVKTFMDENISATMSDYEKLGTAQEYLSDTCSYAASWAENQANTAWGALVYHEAQCSGYARALKALCDGMGVECYYVHADKTASNPSHQFNIVKINGKAYIVDPQLNDTMGSYWPAFLVSESTYTGMTGVKWDHTGLPDCNNGDYWKN